MSRRGTTLVELVLAITLLGLLAVLAGGVVRIAATTNRLALAAHLREQVGQSIAQFLRHDLAEARGADLSLTAPGQLRMDRPVGESRPCASGGNNVSLARADWRGGRAPDAGRDMALLLTDPANGAWRRAAIREVGAGRCPEGAEALELTLDDAVPGARWIRVVEPVEVRIYPSGAADWFGLTPGIGPGTVQPVTGPFPRGGGRFELSGNRLAFGAALSRGGALRLEFPLDGR